MAALLGAVERVIDKSQELSFVDKFNCLGAALSATEAVPGLPATAICYQDARDILKTHFCDKKLLIDNQVMKFADRQPICSSQDVRGLGRLQDNVQGQIRGLRSFGVTEDSFSTLLQPFGCFRRTLFSPITELLCVTKNISD